MSTKNAKIQTLHPDPTKSGVNIDRDKYEQVKSAILNALGDTDGISFQELWGVVDEQLSGSFTGSIGWYYTTVKLDLEARGIIKRSKGSPQIISLSD